MALDFTKPVQTRSGLKVTILTAEARSNWPVAPSTHPAPSVPDAAIDSAIYNQCPDFDDWHEGPSIDDIRAIVRAAMLAAPAQKGGA